MKLLPLILLLVPSYAWPLTLVGRHCETVAQLGGRMTEDCTYFYTLPSPKPSPKPSASPSPKPSPSPSPTPSPVVGPAALNPDLGTFRPFPASDPWNTKARDWPTSPQSATWLGKMGLGRGMHFAFCKDWVLNGVHQGPCGISYFVPQPGTPPQTIPFTWASESDPGPYPFPLDPRVVQPGGGDAHVIAVGNGILAETFHSSVSSAGWKADAGTVFDLLTGKRQKQPCPKCTTADAAGLPIFPGLVKKYEFDRGVIPHALRFTMQWVQLAMTGNATHAAGSGGHDATLPPFGARLVMLPERPCPNVYCEPVCGALKDYGMILADIGSPWDLAGSPSDQWNDGLLQACAGGLNGSMFRVVDTGPVVPY